MNTDTKKQSVLIAEDDEQFRILLRRFLESSYDVILTGDGEEALAVAREKQPAVILTDVLMPKKSGVELLRDLRADESTKNIPVVILLATAFPSDISAAESLHADGILPKEQINRQNLLEMVAKLAAGK